MSEDVVYASNNARNVPAERVAKTFVDNSEFRRLVQHEHSLLLGPRGSGKTTLLKMMTLPALSSWPDDGYAGEKPSLGFVAVYIPADIHWSRQLADLASQVGTGGIQAQRLFSEAAVTTNVLIALCRTMGDRLKYEFSGGNYEAEEARLCADLIRKWYLPSTMPCFESLQAALQDRISKIGEQARRIGTQKNGEEARDDLPPFFYLDYLEQVLYASGQFDALISGEDRTVRWALCFDELEISPSWLQERLIRELRSSDQRILFKLGTSPMPETDVGSMPPQEGDDYVVIRLWQADGKTSRLFSDRLARSILRNHFAEDIDPKVIFGLSVFAGDTESYSPTSKEWKTFSELAEVDASFKVLMEDKGIRFDTAVSHGVDKHDQVLRKAKPIAILRHWYLKTNAQGNKAGRSRKAKTMYSGAEAVYDVCDGNPRWLIGVINDMLRQKRKDDGYTEAQQAHCLDSASTKFMTKLQAIPEQTVDLGSRHKVSLSALLEDLGSFFKEKILADDFTLDPTGSFYIDSDVDSRLHGLLRVAASYGAIVEAEPEKHAISDGLLGRRFRLSFMLAPHYCLPLRLYQGARLSVCQRGSAPKIKPAYQHRLELENPS